MIKHWSISRLSDFETCKYKVKLKVIDKVPEPERPLPEGKTEHANDRGTRIHSEIEAFIKGEGNMPAEAKKYYEAELRVLATEYAKGNVSLEGEWGFDENWQPCEYNKAWLKVKCDAVLILENKDVVVIDFKTGRKFGNEIKHADQAQCYAIGAAIRFPDAETIHTEFWYLDQKPGESGENFTSNEKSAKKWLSQIKLYTVRAGKMLNEKVFKASPSGLNCKWCNYKTICEYAVDSDAVEAQKRLFANANARKTKLTRKK